jgi:ABC-type multidrug transport system ATPase subunit
MRDLIDYFGDTYTIFLCTPVAKELCEACDEILVLEDGTLKSVIPADADALAAMQFDTPVKYATAPEEPQKRKRSRWAMLTEKSGTFEVLEGDEKEGKN